MMAYFYKKDFFGKWKKQKGVSTQELTRVLDFNSPDKIRIWAGEKALPEVSNGKLRDEDRGWIPLKHILRLCNHYGLKLSDFIGNAEEPEPQRQRKQGGSNKELEAMKTRMLEMELEYTKKINALHQEYKATIQDLMKRIPEADIRQRTRVGTLMASEGLEPPKKD